MEVKCQFHTAAVFTSRKRALGTHRIGGLGPITIVDVVNKKVDLARFDSLTAMLLRFQSGRLLLEQHLLEDQTVTTTSAVCCFTD